MRVYYLTFFLILYSCTNNYHNKSFNSSDSDATYTSHLVDLTENEKLILKKQVKEYLKCSGGQDIDAISKYVYKGSLKVLIDQNPEIKDENQALTFLKTGLIQTGKEARKLKLSFHYKVQGVERAINIRNNLIAEFKVITISTRNKLSLTDTTQFLAISNDSGNDWEFLNKPESKEALSYEFSSAEIEEIMSDNINNNN